MTIDDNCATRDQIPLAVLSRSHCIIQAVVAQGPCWAFIPGRRGFFLNMEARA